MSVTNPLLSLPPSRAFAFSLGTRTRLGPWITPNSLRARSLRGLTATFTTPLYHPHPFTVSTLTSTSVSTTEPASSTSSTLPLTRNTKHNVVVPSAVGRAREAQQDPKYSTWKLVSRTYSFTFNFRVELRDNADGQSTTWNRMPAGNDIKEGKNKSCACADLIQGLRGHPSGGGRFYFLFFF